MALWGSLFVDGSCLRHPVRELSRAGSCIALVSDNGLLVAEFRAPVWSCYPQTPQSAEFSAYTWAHVLSVPGHSTAFSDCANVVKMAELPRAEQLSGKRMYSGAFLQCYSSSSSLLP
eukprot:3567294-Pyramimonas_sp.AAC.1